ncbi:MAG: PAS domain S-box protein, partial [Deltaproteobacteria bacterium]|nr:PAS domain S-box protein [Deltaproteobacteria bacterium]
ARKTNEIDSETAVGAVLGELNAAAQRFRGIRNTSQGTRIGALLLLLWVGVMFSRKTSSDLAEQVRLRKEITVAYEELERRVLERTADLQERTLQLARENEERLKSEARTSLILNSAGEGIFGVTKEERVTFFNMAAERLLGYTSDEVIGKELHDLIHHSHADGTRYPRKNCPIAHACAHGEEKHISDEVLWRKDGSMFPSEYSVMPILDDKGLVDGAVVVFRDITERQNNEKELKQRMEELVEAKKEAELATQAKSDFLANMSHEIRTPMNAIIGMSHLALKTDLTPKQHDYVNKIDVAAKSLLGIINDILDFSKIEAGKLAMENLEFDLAKTIENVANMITVKAQDKENLEVLYRLDPRIPPFLVGDSLRLSQVLINLGNNSVKFTEQGEIVLNIELMEQETDQVFLRFSVKDSGVGLTEAQRAKLFQPFSQADASTTRKYGGTGLGLTISQRLVGMMGGKIWVESEYGLGSTFLFTAKLGVGQGLREEKPLRADELSCKRCLVVDDSKTARQVLEEMLISLDFQVDLASSGRMGLEMIELSAREQPYELVFIDWKMPGMDGIETSRRIKG